MKSCFRDRENHRKGSSKLSHKILIIHSCPSQVIFRVIRIFIAKELLVSFPTETHELCWIAVLGGCLFLFWCSWKALWHSVCVCSHRLVDFVLTGFRVGILDVDFDGVLGVRFDLDDLSYLHIVDRAKERSFPSYLAFGEIEVCDASY